MTTDRRTFVIAEAGVNHNGSMDLAMELVDAAAAAGADAFKTQTFSADRLVLKTAPRAAYQERNTGTSESQYEMLKALEIDADGHRAIRARCVERGIEFMSTGFDPDSIRFLVEEIGVSRIKIPSGEATNGPLLVTAYRTGLPVILSTGMCDLDEVLESLSVLAWLHRHPDDLPPSRGALAELRSEPDWTAPLIDRVSVLHCISDYPARADSTNLRAMHTLAEATGLPVGLSDHSEGWHIALAAVAAGARVIEKHYTLSRTLPGPDHAASLEPDELSRMVREIREVEAAMGSGIKAPTDAEMANRVPARGSLVAAASIRAGDAFTVANLTVKRPGTGIPADAYWDYIGGRFADRDYGVDEQIVAPRTDHGERRGPD